MGGASKKGHRLFNRERAATTEALPLHSYDLPTEEMPGQKPRPISMQHQAGPRATTAHSSGTSTSGSIFDAEKERKRRRRQKRVYPGSMHSAAMSTAAISTMGLGGEALSCISTRNSMDYDAPPVPPVPALPSTVSRRKAPSDIEKQEESTTTRDESDDDEAEGDRDEKYLDTEKSLLGAMPLYQRALTMSALALAVFIGSLDQTIVSSSSAAIAKQFDVLDSIGWVATSYLLACTALRPLYGRLSDIFGRIETLMTGLVIFIAGSAICGAATSFNMLIAGRVVQGLGGGALLSLVMVIVSDISIERERAKVSSVFAAIWAVSSILGPIFGGIFAQSKGGWPWVFYFSIPVGGVAGVFILLFLRLPRPQGSFKEKLKKVDFVGIVVLVGGTVMLMLAMSFGGSSHPWSSPTVICLLVFGVVTLGLFVLVEWKIPREPIMPLRLFRNRNTALTLLQELFMGAVFYAPVFYLPIYFNAVMNTSSIASGLHLLPVLLPVCIFSTISGIIVSKTGRYRELSWFGGVLLVVGFYLWTLLDEDTTTGQSIGLLLMASIGCGIILQPSLLTLQTSIQARDMATGTALYGAIQSLGGTIALSIFQTILVNSLKSQFVPIREQFGAQYADIIDGALLSQQVIHYDNVPDVLRKALVRAYVKAIRNVLYGLIAFAAMVFLPTLFLKHIPLRTRMAKTMPNTSTDRKTNASPEGIASPEDKASTEDKTSTKDKTSTGDKTSTENSADANDNSSVTNDNNSDTKAANTTNAASTIDGKA
ncbi:hypothetical protein IW140_002752 [Coemansia sp. RSA 1813]|nr:hypothetical protein EV178_003632 [Coemansia sp. RSA 1646]KAJ1769108.1 hypothetical protein LPJ74_004342 [Coemansia sp. RSA 1843]KAJ2088384.1 hypothetical protein IW138_004260 [Coemansia sp. RSA 986]KAJ2213824.1 hypothetical protein EV179_003523 [Coemansia sp. RSA 487]KAJ2569864.1 hypothetical protein IW140_002752 [Coemansia sp. RSA 1813]